MDINILPYGKILSPRKLGRAVRAKRKADGLTQAKAAALCGVGVRFISDLENGKSTVELGKVLSVLAGLGLTVDVRPKGLRNQGKVKQHKTSDLKKINQNKLADISHVYKNTITKLADSYKGSFDLSSKVFDDLAKHRKDYYSLGISMEKYNDIARSFKHILDLNSTTVSSLRNSLADINNLGISKSTIDVINSVKTSVVTNKDLLASIDKLQSTIGSLNLNTELIDSLRDNYKNNLKQSRNVVQELSKLDDIIYSLDVKKKK